MPASFLANLCVLWLNDNPAAKVPEKSEKEEPS